MLLKSAVRADSVYQRLLREYQSAEQDFCALRERLPERDKEILDRYISLGEELDHRRVDLALQL